LKCNYSPPASTDKTQVAGASGSSSPSQIAQK
jgi:hypothetical protein